MPTRTRKGPPSSRRRRCRRPWSAAHRTCGPLSAHRGSRLAPPRPGRAITIAAWRSPRGTPRCCDRTETYLKQRLSRACRCGHRRRPAPQRKDGSLRGKARAPLAAPLALGHRRFHAQDSIGAPSRWRETSCPEDEIHGQARAATPTLTMTRSPGRSAGRERALGRYQARECERPRSHRQAAAAGAGLHEDRRPPASFQPQKTQIGSSASSLSRSPSLPLGPSSG